MPIIIVYGGQFGDEGKGKISEYMANKYNAIAVVRVGGSQADHTDYRGNVHNVLPTCAGHRISILPHGSYIVPERLYNEMEGLTPDNLMIDTLACIVTERNRIGSKASGREQKIASHGLGTRDAIHGRLRGEFTADTLPNFYEKLKPFVRNTRQWMSEQLAKGEYIIIEGTQGYGLSNHLFDFHPYTTSRTITPDVFCCEAGVNPVYVEERVMCLRTFPIRVGGNSGPLPKEITWELVTEMSGSETPFIECHKNTGKLHRVALFDENIVCRAIDETHPTAIVMNMIDYIDCECKNGKATAKALFFIESVEKILHRQINYIGYKRNGLVVRHDWASNKLAEKVFY